MSPTAWILVVNVPLWTAAGVVLFRRRRTARRALPRWLAAAAFVMIAWGVLVCGLRLMAGVPRPLDAWLTGAVAVPAVAAALAAFLPGVRAATAAVKEALALAGFAVLAVGAYLVFVAGLIGAPTGHEREVLISSLIAALVVAVLAAPTRRWVLDLAGAVVTGPPDDAGDVATAFAARMSRAVPMDELLLQLAESLHAGLGRGGAEIWTGSSGTLNRTVAVPARPGARLTLGEQDRTVVAQARIGGPAWSAVWLPDLVDGAGDSRVAPIAHLGELHGLLVVRRAPGDPPYADDDERSVVEVARQLGLALHNVRLDSALQASLAALARRNEELQASRLRIVAAADASRRQIERNLHDGAQQHLVALAVKLTFARHLVTTGDPAAAGALDGLREDVQATIAELRELAHGIYPPLLRNRGLGEALRTAAARCPLPCTVEVDLPGRFAEPVETAAYFCALEAMQNAAKYAGETATVTVRVSAAAGTLCLELTDDGAGFDPATTPHGHGFENMADRLGALGGAVEVDSSPGSGTAVRVRIPAAADSAGTDHGTSPRSSAGVRSSLRA